MKFANGNPLPETIEAHNPFDRDSQFKLWLGFCYTVIVVGVAPSSVMILHGLEEDGNRYYKKYQQMIELCEGILGIHDMEVGQPIMELTEEQMMEAMIYAYRDQPRLHDFCKYVGQEVRAYIRRPAVQHRSALPRISGQDGD